MAVDKISNIQTKGLIRFSYLAKNGFVLSKQGLEEARSVLYDPARLDRRFRLFETLTLPSLAVQDDPDFALAVLIGSDFPDTARARLEDLLRDFKAAKIVAMPPRVHIKAVVDAYEALPTRHSATHIATFRLDDDDAMHRGATARIKALASALLAVRTTDKPFAIAFNRGFYFDPDNADAPLQEVYERHPLGVGMAVVAGRADRANVFRRNHRNVAQFYDTYTEVDLPMFVRSVHGDNDSGAQNSGRAGKMAPGRMRRIVRDDFGINLRDLEAL